MFLNDFLYICLSWPKKPAVWAAPPREAGWIYGLAKQAQRLMGIHDMTLRRVRWTDSSVNWSVLTSHLLCWPHSGKRWAQSSHGLMKDSFAVTFHWQLTTGVCRVVKSLLKLLQASPAKNWHSCWLPTSGHAQQRQEVPIQVQLLDIQRPVVNSCLLFV